MIVGTDYYTFSIVKRPSKCGVRDKNLMDPLLRSTYRSLGNLPGFVMSSVFGLGFLFNLFCLSSGYQNQGWRDSLDPPRPMVLLSLIKRMYPDADIE